VRFRVRTREDQCSGLKRSKSEVGMRRKIDEEELGEDTSG
jgi:hypothetical protein